MPIVRARRRSQTEAHDHDTDHRSKQGARFRDGPPAIAAGQDVWIGARDEERGRRAAEQLGARFVQLDVTDDGSVETAARTVGSLDVLVNNAGITGGRASAAELTAGQLLSVYDTNVLGPVRVLHAFLPLLERSPTPVIVNVSSGLGSLALAADPDSPWAEFIAPAYSSSKAALNMITIKYAVSFPEMRINAVDPGYTATDLNGHSGPQSVEEGATAIVRHALIGADGPTGGFFDKDGTVAW